jgi:hypothetical protein
MSLSLSTLEESCVSFLNWRCPADFFPLAFLKLFVLCSFFSPSVEGAENYSDLFNPSLPQARLSFPAELDFFLL